MLWTVHAQKVPQPSKHLCLAKLQASCDVYYETGKDNLKLPQQKYVLSKLPSWAKILNAMEIIEYLTITSTHVWPLKES